MQLPSTHPRQPVSTARAGTTAKLYMGIQTDDSLMTTRGCPALYGQGCPTAVVVGTRGSAPCTERTREHAHTHGAQLCARHAGCLTTFTYGINSELPLGSWTTKCRGRVLPSSEATWGTRVPCRQGMRGVVVVEGAPRRAARCEPTPVSSPASSPTISWLRTCRTWLNTPLVPRPSPRRIPTPPTRPSSCSPRSSPSAASCWRNSCGRACSRRRCSGRSRASRSPTWRGLPHTARARHAVHSHVEPSFLQSNGIL